MITRLVLCSAALAVMLLAPAAFAQVPDVPCEIGRWGGGGYTTPGGAAYDSSQHRLDTWHVWSLTVGFESLSLDRLDGAQIPSVDVDRYVLIAEGSWDPGWNRELHLTFVMPYLSVENTATGESASGFGDFAIGAAFDVPAKGSDKTEVEVVATTPGDDEDDLSYDDWTAYAGGRWTWTLEGPPIHDIELAVGFRYNASNQDFNEAVAQLAYVATWEKNWLRAELTDTFETAGRVDLPSGLSRDARNQLIVGTELGFFLGETDARAWNLILGVSSELTEDGYSDSLSWRLGFQAVMKP